MSESKIWAEPLPERCPPSEAFPPDGSSFYRIVNSFPPTPSDFYSKRKLYPLAIFNANECIARAISVYKSYEACYTITKLPKYKSKTNFVVSINLPPSSGVVMQTFNDKNHYSWWCTANFNPIQQCQKM